MFVHKNREAFKSLAEDAYDFITYQTGARKFQQWKEEYRTEEGGYDMCKAIDDMMKHSREEGEKRGEKRGEDRMAELVRRLLSENRIQDVQKILKNKRYRGNMYKQYGL